MIINRLGREVYAVEVIMDPVAEGTWQASFDGGTTWTDGQAQPDGSFGWLVAGPDNDGGDAIFKFNEGDLTTTPLLRLIVGNEEIVVHGPSIDIG